MNKELNNNNITEIVFILDKSGSMCGMEEDTIGGFNSMIENQKMETGKVFVSTILFSNYSKVLHDRLNLEDISPLTKQDYRVGGGTALLDAIGDAIKHVGNVHKYARREDVPGRTMFIITTDGMENASYKYSSNQIKEMIGNQERKYGWEFLFLGANIDAVETAESIGIKRERAVNYDVKSNTVEMYAEVSDTICNYRRCGEVRTENMEKNIKDRKK